jgi:hypothetical protein
VNVQTKYELASQMAATEANCLSDIAHLSHIFPEKQKEEIRQEIYNYAVTAHTQNWANIADNIEEEKTIPYYRHLWKSITDLPVDTNKEQASYSNLLSRMSQLSDARRFRMIAANGIPYRKILSGVHTAAGVRFRPEWFTKDSK